MNFISQRLAFIKKLNFIVKNSGDFSLSYIIVLLIFKAFFETMGIGLIYPFLDLIINQDLLNENFIYNYTLERGWIKNSEIFFLMIGFSLIGFFTITAIFSVYAKLKSDDFIWKVNTNIVKLSYKKHISTSLDVFKKSNSNKVTHDIINEVHIFINGFLLNFIDFVPRFFLLLFFICYLMIINPIVTFFAFIFLALFYGLILKFLKRKIDQMSTKRYSYQTSLFDYVNSSIRALKDIKINAFEEYFVDKVKQPAQQYSILNRDISVYAALPKFFIETVVLITMVIYVLFSFNKTSLVDEIPMLSVLTLSLVKLMPITQAMFTNITRIRFNFKSLNVIENNLLEVMKRDATNSQAHYDSFEQLCFKNVDFSYSDKMVLSDQNLTINKQDFWLLYGESGSGKTTLTELMLGFLEPSKGSIILNGTEKKDHQLLSKRFKVGYVSQDIILFEGDLIENITLKSSESNPKIIDKVNELIKFCALEDVVDSIGGLNGFISEGGKNLSAGQKQRIIIARALYKVPDILILDEATSALNAHLEAKIIEGLLDKQITIFMITHNENLKKYSENIINLP